MKKIWNKVSNLGIKAQNVIPHSDSKRNVFFNQALFIGFFATFSQIVFVWPFIGTLSLLFLIVNLFLLVSLFLNAKQYFDISKWVYVLSIYSMGILTTLLLGGAALYHIQSLLIFTSCLILFDWKKERIQILIGIPLMLLSLLIGEYNWFNPPDFSNHYWTPIARIANISSLIFVNTILISFIIRLNRKYETDLTKTLKELTSKTVELRKNKIYLETIVTSRTSELSKKNEILELQNEEKEVLLMEIHHRVRNNLQIITSLINLQKKNNKNQLTQNALLEIQGRVESMSLVHQKMYKTANFKEIKLKSYTENIIQNIGELYGQKDVNCEIDIPEEIFLKMDTAIPFGLVINEIIANFFKHVQIPSSNEKQFKIKAYSKKDKIMLIYHDNGTGFSEEFNLKKSSSLGYQLIDSLINQIEGTLETRNNNGAQYVIELPLL